ncbi:YceI family protein [Nonomuraea sp. NPDC000554]|uniref:YceI family protein n=1 Tax=Nonomuraea sp. NPDC000554 TaxID=3154259 RepID=UPI00332470F9
MSITAGSYTLGPESGRLLVHTTRTGLGAKAGHDLTIEVTRWRGDAMVDTVNAANSSVSVEIDAESFEVREGTGGVKPLTDSDREEIGKTLRTKILHTDRYSTITFRSTRVDGTAESFHAEGDLTIVGVTRPVTVQGVLTDGRVQGSAVIVQSRWGIRPYSAFFGALKVSDEVELRFDLGLAPRQ